MKSVITVLIVAMVMATATMIAIRFIKYQQRIRQLIINPVDLSEVEDGTYRDSFDLELVKAEVEVRVRDGRIEEVRIIRHDTARGKKAVGVVDRVIREQRVNTDVVAGATASSKVILKAIEKALTSGTRPAPAS